MFKSKKKVDLTSSSFSVLSFGSLLADILDLIAEGNFENINHPSIYIDKYEKH